MTLLNLKETSQLVAILQMEGSPFEAILESLKTVARPETSMRICLALRCMVFDEYYHTADKEYNTELLITCFIFHSLSHTQGNQPPPNTKSALFHLLQLLEGQIREKEGQQQQSGSLREKIAVKVFILTLLAGKREVLSRTPKDVLQDSLPDLMEKHTQLANDKQLVDNLKEAQQLYEEELNINPPALKSKGVTPILVPPDINNVDTGPIDEWRFHEKEALDLRFNPIFDRPPPPPLGVGEQELSWLYTEGHAMDVVWDTTSPSTSDESLELRDRVQKALRQNLASEEQQSLKQKLSQNPDALLRVGVTPQRFPTLVERNSTVATHFITTLVANNFEAAEEFLVALVNMNPCLGACNVMSELVKMQQLPASYATEFIVNSMRCIRNSNDTRRIAVICVFCLSLARETDSTSPRGRILQSADLVDQLTQFAVENASVSEANQLFKALKEQAGQST